MAELRPEAAADRLRQLIADDLRSLDKAPIDGPRRPLLLVDPVAVRR